MNEGVMEINSLQRVFTLEANEQKNLLASPTIFNPQKMREHVI